MQISIWFSGPAGSGVNTAGILLAELLTQKGYTVLGDKEYASIIKGDNNCFFSLYFWWGAALLFVDRLIIFSPMIPMQSARMKASTIWKKSFMIKDENCKYKNTFTLGAALKFWDQLGGRKNILGTAILWKGILPWSNESEFFGFRSRLSVYYSKL